MIRANRFARIALRIARATALIPLSMLFFPKKRGLAEKGAVSLLFCPFLRFFGPKKAPFPHFRIATYAFFVKTALF